MNEIIAWVKSLSGTLASKILLAVIILAAGMLAIKLAMKLINKFLEASKMEKAAHSLIRTLARVVLLILLALTVVSSLGIDITGIIALTSVITLAVSLALQNALANVIGGFTLLYTHPFGSGDFVEIAGQSGTVSEVGIAYTKLITPDNKLVQIPNGTVVANDITNFTCTGTRRVDITVSASYNAPVAKVLAALEKAGNVDGILTDPAIFTNVTEYGDNAISYVVRVWCPTDLYWDVHKAVTLKIKDVFDADGIEMTYPHLNVHLDK